VHGLKPGDFKLWPTGFNLYSPTSGKDIWSAASSAAVPALELTNRRRSDGVL
jgi:hypothetical protein